MAQLQVCIFEERGTAASHDKISCYCLQPQRCTDNQTPQLEQQRLSKCCLQPVGGRTCVMRATARQVRATHTLVQLADSVADPVPVARPEARLCSSMSCSFLYSMSGMRQRHQSRCGCAANAVCRFCGPRHSSHCVSRKLTGPACKADAGCRLGATQNDRTEAYFQVTIQRHKETPS